MITILPRGDLASSGYLGVDSRSDNASSSSASAPRSLAAADEANGANLDADGAGTLKRVGTSSLPVLSLLLRLDLLT